MNKRVNKGVNKAMETEEELQLLNGQPVACDHLLRIPFEFLDMLFTFTIFNLTLAFICVVAGWRGDKREKG